MARYTITPWRTQADLLQVRDQLYDNDASPSARREAVDRIQAWKLRGNLPHAVESTALLTEAILHHDINTNSTFSIRAVYSAAFTRFVTGFCDIGRNKERTLEPSSMLDIAKQIGMPTEFVALRHEATHEELPGLKRLVTATRQGLEWLWGVYWSRLEEPESEEVVRCALEVIKEEVAAVLREFRRARRDALRRHSKPAAGEPGDVASTAARCVEMCKTSAARVDAVAGILVEERLILPSSREIGSSLEGAYLLWDEFLITMCTSLRTFLNAFGTNLLRSLTATSPMEPSTDVDKEALVMWLLYVVRDDRYLSACNHDQRALFAMVMKWCCLYPGHWTAYVGREIMEAADESLRDEWSDLFEASVITSEVSASKAGAQDLATEGTATTQGSVPEYENVAVGGWSRAIATTAAPIGVVR